MTFTLPLIIRFVHVLSAALWMGAALSWPGALRRALKAGPEHLAPALAQARVGLGLDLGAGLATVVSGLVYVTPSLGGASMSFPLTVGFVLAVVRLALLFAVARPAVRGVAEAAGRAEPAAAVSSARRVPAYAGMAHLLWLAALVCMVFGG